MKIHWAAALALLTAIQTSTVAAKSFEEAPVSQRSGDTATQDKAPEQWLIDAAKGWMSNLPDDTPLQDISIPCTHDSGALHGGAFVEAQSWSIAEQLKAGIRYLDIRLRPVTGGKTGAFAVHHGVVYQKMNFDDVLTQVQSFLRKYPHETVLMWVKQCSSGCDPMQGAPSFQTIWSGPQVVCHRAGRQAADQTLGGALSGC